MRRLLAIVALCLAAAACSGSGGSDGEVAEVAEPTQVLTEAPTAPVASEEPTSTAAPEVVESSDEEKIAAAIAVLESEPLPADLVAYDVIEAGLRGTTGVVDIEVCGWTGDTVFDDVYLLSYRLSVAADGAVAASLESATTAPGDCTNTTLIESALRFTRDYEVFWRGVINDPSTFDPAAAEQFWTPAFTDLGTPVVEQLADDGLSYRGDYFDASLPDSSIVEVLYRTYVEEQVAVLELISCRELPANFGLYRNEVLVDDFRGTEDAIGNHAMLRYFLVRSNDRWLLINDKARVRSDCLASATGWFEGVNTLFEEPVRWKRLPDA